jgi:hypothetical protein
VPFLPLLILDVNSTMRPVCFKPGLEFASASPTGPAENRGCAESLLTGQIAGNGTGKLFGGSVAYPRILDLSALEGV